MGFDLYVILTFTYAAYAATTLHILQQPGV